MHQKTYEGQTLKEIKKEYPNHTFTYQRYKGLGDHGVQCDQNPYLFFCDDYPLMDRHNWCQHYNYTGIKTNLDFSCEVFIKGASLGKTSKHRAKIFLKFYDKGIDVDTAYLSSTRYIRAFLPDASNKNKQITKINALAHAIIEEGGEKGHKARNRIRYYAYRYGIEAAKEKFLNI